jgi:hypothetical protein
MSRLTLGVLAIGLLLFASPASAYVWRCHTPNGDVWTSQPPQSGNCEEYDGTFNPNAAPQAAPPVQYAPQQYEPQYAPPPPPPPAYAYPYPYPYPVPYPYYPYPRYYGGPGPYLGLPPFIFDFRFGGHGGHGGHWH